MTKRKYQRNLLSFLRGEATEDRRRSLGHTLHGLYGFEVFRKRLALRKAHGEAPA